MNENYFTELNSVDVSEKTEKKGQLTYLSWAWAWGEVKKRHPDATYTIYENESQWNYFSDGRTCWVKTGVTVNGIEHIEYLPVMDARNKSISLENVTSFDVNKTIQRSLTKACARHGLGLYIYAGEDLPEAPPIVCADCGEVIKSDGKHSPEWLAQYAVKKVGVACCPACAVKRINAQRRTEAMRATAEAGAKTANGPGLIAEATNPNA